MIDTTGPRNELRERILAKLLPVLQEGPAGDEARADAVMELFWTVEDDWDRLDITALGEAGQSFIDNRWLVARVPVQGVHSARTIDRSVSP